MKEPETKSDERDRLTLKRISVMVKQELAGETGLIFTGCSPINC